MNSYWNDWGNVMRETKQMIEQNGGIMPDERTIVELGYRDMLKSLRRQNTYRLWRKVYGETGQDPPLRMVEPPLNHRILNDILK